MTSKYNFTYESYKYRWETTKPIRGRDTDIRPISKRRRDWEQIVKVSDTAYAAKLYNTNVVTYHEDGRIDLAIDTWATPLTAEFMTNHSPFIITKQRGNLWAKINGQMQIIPAKRQLTVRKENDAWVVLNAPEVKQIIVDRIKMKQVRERVKPFLTYAETMLKLSDGWVMNDSLSKYDVTDPADWRPEYDFGFNTHDMVRTKFILKTGGVKRNSTAYNRTYYTDNNKIEDERAVEQIIEMMNTENYSVWDRLMYQMLENAEAVEERTVKSVPIVADNPKWKFDRVYKDKKYALSCIRTRVDAILKTCDVFTTRTVDTSACVRSNLIV